MPLSDKDLREELRELVSEAGRRKSANSDRIGGVGFLAAAAASVGVVVLLSAATDLSWWIQGLAAVAVLFVVFIGAFFFEEPIAQRQIDRAAERFRRQFPKETGDYDRATALLRGITTDSEVEKDLLKALGWDVAFADEGATELLGDFAKGDVEDPGVEQKARAVDDPGAPGEGADSGDPAPLGTAGYIPLDPYDPARDAVDENVTVGGNEESAKKRH